MRVVAFWLGIMITGLVIGHMLGRPITGLGIGLVSCVAHLIDLSFRPKKPIMR